MSKIHWSPQPGKLACRRNIGATSAYRGALSSREFVTKHEDSPDECAHLRALVAYLSQGFVGPEARKGLEILKRKLS